MQQLRQVQNNSPHSLYRLPYNKDPLPLPFLPLPSHLLSLRFTLSRLPNKISPQPLSLVHPAKMSLLRSRRVPLQRSPWRRPLPLTSRPYRRRERLSLLLRPPSLGRVIKSPPPADWSWKHGAVHERGRPK